MLLAIPSDANIVVSIGDNILIDSAQRTSTPYTVLGVEMARGLPPDRCGLALLVKSESNISSGDTVWTDRSIIEEIQIQFNGTVERLQSAIFPDASGFLRFGPSSRSTVPATFAELFVGAVEFQDYIMEGFVRYLLTIANTEGMMTVRVGLTGTNRDRYVRTHIAFHLATSNANEEAPIKPMDRSGGSAAS